ncbi:metal ABC transporter ATP-binding protein [Aeromicrobium sp. YIM 150415]|uniref:Metal ABC transporter ATP-binding protein n=1 Tax=Aeromicrobium piscarium TaxID=2590901 RepID=A0A554SGJ8_9ACTN|nr:MULTISPECIES: metal ABC transporter ATP-binding protein [Aeromicrobium]MBM9462810.1 metal ABC transporter ATP-binding protein [Aeromicrobium sp. YIM 150415]TSD65475.1 metal ABC transporter ATP-binding protein [Aeromicrobium piscarium]
MTSPLTARGVEVDLAGGPVVRGVDLTVGTGEFVTLLGANGSGKSTLVRALVGLIPARGSIELFGTPLARFRDRWRLGYVPQRPGSSSGVPATVREVVTSGRLAHRPLLGFASRSDRAAVDEAISHVRLGAKADQPITELSGGQQQRAYIARALVGDPQLLVMDEPTAGVDAESASVLASLIGHLVDDHGMAVLMVAHELGPMRALVDRAVVIDAGRVSYEGPVDGVRHDHAHDHPHIGAPERVRPVPEEGPLG